jgi:hypothetical protein
VVTFAAPIPDLLDRDDRWARPRLTAGQQNTRQLPPPPPGAVPTPGPAPWLHGGNGDYFGVGSLPRGTHSVVGREVADAFELIWPTGEIDEQFLGGPLSEMPAPGAPYDDAFMTNVAGPLPLPMTVRLKPLTTPPAIDEPSWSEPVSDDVVLAIQRAIAAIGSELVVADEPGAAPHLPARSSESDFLGASRTSTADASDGSTPPPATDPTDARRSALKRLIGGLRRR